MTEQMISQAQKAAESLEKPNFLARFTQTLEAVYRSVMGSAPKSDPATRKSTLASLERENPALAAQANEGAHERPAAMKSGDYLTGQGHSSPLEMKSETVELSRKKKS